MAPPNKTTVPPNAPTGTGGTGNFRSNKSPVPLGKGAGTNTTPPGKPPVLVAKPVSVTFKSRIKFVNEGEAKSIPGISFPAKLNARVPAPNFLSPTDVQKLLRNESGGQQGTHMTSTKGLTRVDNFAIAFDSPATQWKVINVGGAQPRYQFQGGVVYFDLSIGVYIQDGFKPDANVKYSQEIFKLIYEHELEHVLDEFEIFTDYMPVEAPKYEWVKQLLSSGALVPQALYTKWIDGGELKDHLYKHVWAPEHNRRGGVRDSAGNYGALSRKINDLFVKQSNPSLNLE